MRCAAANDLPYLIEQITWVQGFSTEQRSARANVAYHLEIQRKIDEHLGACDHVLHPIEHGGLMRIPQALCLART